MAAGVRGVSGGRTPGKRFLAQTFIISEIRTGVVRSRVPADRGGNLPVERIAGMLAMHCLALNRRLEDFEVLVLPQSPLPARVTERAKRLIAAGRSIGRSVNVSSTQLAVLDGVVQNLSNKEIASRLDITVSAVKFHVSSLLAKFNVSNRTALSAIAKYPLVASS